MARPVATTQSELIAVVAAMTEQVEGLRKDLARFEGKLDKIDGTVDAHGDWIKARKRDGWWLSGALVGLGILASKGLDVIIKWAAQ